MAHTDAGYPNHSLKNLRRGRFAPEGSEIRKQEAENNY